jgi:hypothetical protein
MQSLIASIQALFPVTAKGAVVLIWMCGFMFVGLAGFVVNMMVTTDYRNVSYSSCHVSDKPEPYNGGFRGSLKIYPITTSCGSFKIVRADLADSISLDETYDIVTGPKTTLHQPDVISAVPSKK